jgi:hypothetical protein
MAVERDDQPPKYSAGSLINLLSADHRDKATTFASSTEVGTLWIPPHAKSA